VYDEDTIETVSDSGEVLLMVSGVAYQVDVAD
jgi:hypothetical protein